MTNTIFRTTVTAALVLALTAPALANAAPIPSTAPTATVARGQKEVLVMDFTLPAYAGDAVVDADGGVTEDVGVPLVQAGAPLHNIPSSARLAYGIGGQSDPKSIWIDRDGSKRYTPNFSADTTVAQPDVLGLPVPDGDVSAPLKTGGMGNLKILVSNPTELNTWHPTDSDALYKDSGLITNLVDSGDARVSAGIRFKQQSELVPDKAMILLRAAGNICPTGIAPEDFVHILGKPNIAVKEIIYDHELASGACTAQVVLYTAVYSYSIEDQFELVTPYVGELNITDLKDNGDNGVPDAQTKSIKILSGTAKGIAAGDIIRIVRGNASIRFRVDELSSVAKVLNVTYLDGSLEGPPGDYGVAVTEHKNHSSTLTGLLSGLPNWVQYADENGDNVWNNNEPLYSDEDGNGVVSKNDKRLTGTTAEKRLLKKAGAVDSLGGVYVDSATMAAPKWLSQLKPWAEGVDIAIDHDNDGFYNLDQLRNITVRNQGTAIITDITRVQLWMEDSGMAGFQGSFTDQSSDLLMGSFVYDASAQHWRIANLDQPLITAERFYITANVATNAGDQRTMQFAIAKDDIGTTHRTLPDAVSANSNAQTISAAAQIPPEQQGPAGVSAQNSIVHIVDRTSAPSDGTSLITIEIEVRDTNNERMPNKTAQLERLRAAEDNVLSTQQKVTNGLGIASFPVTSQEAGVFRFRGRVGTLLLGSATVTFTAVGDEPPGPTPGGKAGLVEGDLFMSASAGKGGTVYYYANNKKYPFPNEKVYLSWYPDFKSVTIKKINAVDVGDIAWGTNVRYRPGTRMIKVPDDQKVYAVTLGGKVCWVKNEDVAKKFYGPTWNKKIDDLLASLFVGTYRNDPTCDLTLDSKYPSGTILAMNGKNYYVDGARVRLIDDAAWTSNRFRNEFVLQVSSLDNYEAGPPVYVGEFSRAVD
ncbi:MAG: hypothetical protein AAB633_01085 [Patescibacteria group bacterium]